MSVIRWILVSTERTMAVELCTVQLALAARKKNTTNPAGPSVVRRRSMKYNEQYIKKY